MTSEEGLLSRAQQFDLKALAEIYDTFRPSIYGYALRLLGNADLAEECVAETFNRFLLALRTGRGPKEHLRAYLYRIAHNWITDQYRRVPTILPLESTTETDPASPLHQILIEHMEQEQVRRALASLTPDQRQVVVLKFLEEWTHEEIAVALGKPVGAVKSLQHRAIASLQRLLITEEEKNESAQR